MTVQKQLYICYTGCNQIISRLVLLCPNEALYSDVYVSPVANFRGYTSQRVGKEVDKLDYTQHEQNLDKF